MRCVGVCSTRRNIYPRGFWRTARARFARTEVDNLPLAAERYRNTLTSGRRPEAIAAENGDPPILEGELSNLQV